MKLGLLVICAFLFTLVGYAQEPKTITGIVLDANDLPLPGAEVKVVGKEIFDVTDFDGNFTLEGVVAGDSFRVTFLGFTAQEFPIGDSNQYVLNLQEDQATLDEVVVIGYGTQQKQDLTGAISQVSSAEIMRQPSSTATQALQGKVAGVNIINSDAPGATPTVTIRGLGTALGGRDPLYVVDGTPVNDIQNISPGNIESIDFLKDASSAAIYGVRAANGVIIVTTKQGRAGAATMNFRSFYGVKPILNQVRMANASQYITYFNEENAAVGGDQLSQNQRYDTDWFDELTQVGHVNNIVMDISGGGENVNYFFSYDYYEEEGVLQDQKFRRSTITSNNTFRLFDDRFRIIQNLTLGIRQDNPKPFGAFNVAFRQSPLVPVFYDNGRYGVPFYNRTTGEATYVAGEGQSIGNLTSHGNPVAEVNFANQVNNMITLQGSVTAEFDITDNITLSSRYGARKEFFRGRSYNPIRERYLAADPTRTIEQFENLQSQNEGNTQYADNSLSYNSFETYKYNWDNFVNFNHSLGSHNLDITLGGSMEQLGIGMNDSYQVYGVPENEQYWSVRHGSDAYETQVNQTYTTPTNFLSYFGRVQYNFNRKYYFTGTLRRDGSSTFQQNQEYYGTFPAVGLGWTVSNEEFLLGSEIINFLKLRASWGELGNANVPFNATQISTNPGSSSMNYVLGPDQRLVYGAFIGSLARDISWEIVEELSIGLDYELFNRRLTGSLDYYHRTTENTILQIQPLLNSTFSSNFFDHGAEVINKGFEVSANWRDQFTDDFNFNLGVNVSYNDNEVTSVQQNYEGQLGGSLGFGGISTKRLAQGQPLGAWWMYETQGVWQNQQEIDNNPSRGPARPGHLRYVDQNNDGLIDERDKVYMGSYIPNLNYGVNLAMNYRQFDLSIDGYGVGGNKVYNALNAMRLGGENLSVEMFDNRWTGPNSTNTHPGASRDIEASDYYLESGAFFRINNITLGYSLPEFSNLIRNIRIYASAQNPVIFTRYSGFTPELNSNGNPYGTTGIELDAYPITSTYLVGINISL